MTKQNFVTLIKKFDFVAKLKLIWLKEDFDEFKFTSNLKNFDVFLKNVW